MSKTPLEKLQNAKLVPPDNPAVLWDVLMLANQNANRGYPACLGVCWRGVGRPAARYDASDPAGYGGKVLNELLQRGLRYNDIMAAGAKAYAEVAQKVPGAEAVEQAEGNSEATEEEATPA